MTDEEKKKRSVYYKEYRKKNKDAIDKRMRAHYEENKDRYREIALKNKESRRESSRRYKAKNKEKVRAARKAYYQKNKEQILSSVDKAAKREYYRDYCKNNKEKMLDKNKRYYQKNKELRKQKIKDYTAGLTDYYVKNTLTNNSKGGLKPSDIPRELIELKREQLKLHRLIKERQ